MQKKSRRVVRGKLKVSTADWPVIAEKRKARLIKRMRTRFAGLPQNKRVEKWGLLRGELIALKQEMADKRKELGMGKQSEKEPEDFKKAVAKAMQPYFEKVYRLQLQLEALESLVPKKSRDG